MPATTCFVRQARRGTKRRTRRSRIAARLCRGRARGRPVPAQAQGRRLGSDCACRPWRRWPGVPDRRQPRRRSGRRRPGGCAFRHRWRAGSGAAAVLLGKMDLPDEERAKRIDLQKRIQAAVLGQGTWDGVPEPMMKQANTAWFQSFLGFTPATVMPKVKQPLLILQGDIDRRSRCTMPIGWPSSRRPKEGDGRRRAGRQARWGQPLACACQDRGSRRVSVPGGQGPEPARGAGHHRLACPRHATRELRGRLRLGGYSYRRASIGSRRLARIAGSRPATRPTDIRMPEQIASSSNDSSRWMSVLRWRRRAAPPETAAG